MAIRQQATSLGGLPIQIDYTARDFDSIRSEMIKLVETLTPDWTDRQPGDMGVSILEAVAYIADILSYTLDRNINESYLATAQTRESVVGLLRLIGYEMSPASPATVNMVIRTTQDNVTLPQGFRVRTGSTSLVDAIEYEISQPVVLGLAGYHAVSTEVAQCLRVFAQEPETNDDLVFVAGERVNLEVLGASDGQADQKFILGQDPVCLNADGTASIQIFVDSVEWVAKTSFLGAEPTSQVFVYRITAEQEAIIEFGDGVTGAIPNNNATITASYRINGGASTNRAGVGSITLFDSVNGVDSVYNLNQPSGGSDPEDIDTAKKQGPLSLRALDRCITLEDFETVALKVPGGGLRAAKAIQGNSPIEVTVYVATEGENPIPSGRWYSMLQNGFGMLGSVGRWLNTKKPVPTILKVEPPTVVKPYLEANIYLYNNVIKQSVEYEVDANLQDLILGVSNRFGDGITLSSVIQSIENTQGVDYLDVVAFHRLPSLRFVSGNEDSFNDTVVSFTNINRQIERATYRVVWLGTSRFKLEKDGLFLLSEDGSDSFYLANQVNTVTFYYSNAADNEPSQRVQFELEITTGTTLPVKGNVWEFSVDNYSDNIVTMPYEIVVSPIQNNGLLNPSEINLTFIGGIG